MLRTLRLIPIIMLAAGAAACGYASPGAGQAAVLVEKPYFFGHGGVDAQPVTTGTQMVAASTEVVLVPIVPLQSHVSFDDLMTSDGVPLDFEASVQFRITDAVKLVKDYGADEDGKGNWGFFARNLEQPFRMAVRDAVKKHGLNEMAITVTAAAQVDAEATAALQAAIAATGAPIQLLGVTLGRANPPDAIKHQRIATAEQEQRVNTEKQRKLAEDQRKAAEESRAAADRAYNEKMGLDPQQYIQLEQLKVWRDTCGKSGACTFFLGADAVVPTLPVKK